MQGFMYDYIQQPVWRTDRANPPLQRARAPRRMAKLKRIVSHILCNSHDTARTPCVFGCACVRACHKGSARLPPPPPPPPTTTTRARTTIIIIFKFVSVHNGALGQRRADARIGFCVGVVCASLCVTHETTGIECLGSYYDSGSAGRCAGWLSGKRNGVDERSNKRE